MSPEPVIQLARSRAGAGLTGAAVLTLVLWACGQPRQPGPGVQQPAGAERAPLLYETKTLEQLESDCSDPETCARVSLEYPEITAAPSEAALEALNDSIAARLLAPVLGEGPAAPTPAALARGFLDEAASAARELPAGAFLGVWSLERKIAVIHQDARAFSIEASQLWFTGGAHSNSFNILASFDPGTGRRLQLADLLVPGFEPRLREAAERRFREVREIPEGQTLTEAGFWFEDDVFTLNGNFAVADSGLAFHFDPYEVAPYAWGPTDFVVSREQLGDLVRPDGPLAAR